jgi:YtcA family
MIGTGMKSRFAQRLAKIGKACLTFAALQCAVACSRAPTFNILGSFFPSWILCGVIGIVLAVIVRLFFVRIKLEPLLTPLIVVYPCLALFFTFTIWLIFFS